MVVKIILIVLASLFGIYLLLAFVDIACFAAFHRNFRIHDKAAVVYLNNKLDALNEWFDEMEKAGVNVDSSIREKAAGIVRTDLSNNPSEASKKAREQLSSLRDDALILSGRHPDLEANPAVAKAKANANELENIYRNNVIMYNADVLGYNFWVGFWPCRYIYKIFRIKKKELI